jgi:hypothetical protein
MIAKDLFGLGVCLVPELPPSAGSADGAAALVTKVLSICFLHFAFFLSF